ncbi:MAG TPA: glycosyltransferase family 4 protein [Chthoniobacter sp.]|nr:glycosyltransferase family 4 protein [Chthoniobacter sp.]
MKLLVFAHTPPPHHGQSYMVKLMLDGLGGDRRRAPRDARPGDIECYHVNSRYSDAFEDIGSFRVEKMWLVLRYCLEAIWCRFRYGVRTFYYVPAPGKRAALYRDWVVMLLCRPFFRDFVHHWHAVGLGDWLSSHGTWLERRMTHWLLGRCSLGIALAIPSMRDALWFRSRDVQIVPNGIPDPCPDFEEDVLPYRRARVEARRRLLAGQTLSEAERTAADGDPEVFHVLYLAHCTRQKGLFDTLEAVAAANEKLLQEGSPLRCRLTVAGAFLDPREETEFQYRVAQPDLLGKVHYAGFVEAEEKRSLLYYSDCLCFPTFYHAESFGLVVVEALAAGLVVLTTRWRALPDLLPADYPGFVPIENPAALSRALVAAFQWDATDLRATFLAQFVEGSYVTGLARALHTVEEKSRAA